jgi:Fe-S cluster assembly protein SufD
MTSTTTETTNRPELAIRDLFNKSQSNNKTSPALKKFNQAALEKLEALKFPDRKHEMYTFVGTRELVATEFALTAPGTIAKKQVDPLIYSNSKNSCLVFVDGNFCEELSDISSLGAGVRLTPLSEAIEQVEVSDYLLGTVKDENDVFSAMNGALVSDGLVLEITENTKVDVPLQILYISSDSKTPVFHCPRILILARRSSALDVVVKFSGGATSCFVNAVQDILVEENAQITYSQFQNDSAWHFSKLRATLKRDSRFIASNAMSGAHLARCHYEMWLTEPGAELQLNSLSVLHKEEQAHNYVQIHHQAEHCTSTQLFRNLVDDKSRSSIDGTVVVHPGAQLTSSEQLINNLMLSDECRADNKPNLKIYADDVKCTHGATVGQLNEDQVFYLKTRGLSEATARTLLTRSFAESMIQTAPSPQVAEDWRNVLLKKLGTNE